MSAVRLHVEGAVATLVLDRPAKLNVLTPEMLRELDDALRELGGSAAVRVVLVRGAGERAFCAGADIERFAGLDPLEMWRAWTVLGHEAFERLARLRQPVIAVVHGNAFGGGLELALAADFRVVAEHARLGLPEAGLGTVPGWGGTERLVEIVGRARAKEVVVARRVVDAATAERWGLATRCVPVGELNTAVAELTATVLAGAPVAVELAKQLVDAAADGASSRVLEPLAAAVTAATSDLGEGVAAFRARRTPAFQGH
jgi:enoyl-CoA hydratase/carnithine racemase